jgi:nucleoside-diphosphate-sugar epimerase
MKILVTGNLGYIGPVVTSFLSEKFREAQIIGFDTAYFAQSITGAEVYPEKGLYAQYFGDIRQIDADLLRGVDAVVHLAAISNDPMGKEFEDVTIQINRSASVRLVESAVKSGVKNFVFASSCSMYGFSKDGARKESDETNPLTAYAKSKIGTEEDVKKLNLGDMVFTSLRFATACGWSPRLRLDLVLNDFVACAITSGEITILSDGSPKRPLIDVEDMARAISWALVRKVDTGGAFLAVNTGRNEANYQVKDLAVAVGKLIEGIRITTNPDALPDKRSYAVDFSLFEELAPEYLPKVTLVESIRRLIEGLRRMKFSEVNFRESHMMRLHIIRHLRSSGYINSDLYWK